MSGSPYRPAGDNITLASEGYEEKIAVRRVEWKRIRNRVEKLENPLSDASSWFEIAYGTAAGTLVSLLLLWGDGDPSNWLIATLVILIVASVAVGMFMQKMAKKVSTVQHDSAVAIVEEMDEIERAFVKRERAAGSKKPTSASSAGSAATIAQGMPLGTSSPGSTNPYLGPDLVIGASDKKLMITPEGKVEWIDSEPDDEDG